MVSIAQKHSTSGVIIGGDKPIGDFTDYAATCIDDVIKTRLGS
jgi:hypothetical protein